MGKHKHHHKQKQRKPKPPLQEDQPLIPMITPADDIMKAAKELDDAWGNIDIYFSLLWEGSTLKKGEWWDFWRCLEIAKTGLQEAAIHEYVKLRLLHRAKKLADAKTTTKLALAG